MFDHKLPENGSNSCKIDRKRGTMVDGREFTTDIKDAVWEKSRIIYNLHLFRRDICGGTINYSNYGQEIINGWEIDHILPVSMGGTDEIENLQPLHWENNRSKGDNFTDWESKICD